MPNLQDLRRRNLKALIKEWDGPTNLATKLGHSGPSYLSQLVSGNRPITENTARAIEVKLALPPRWLDGETHERKAQLNVSLLNQVMKAASIAVEEVGVRMSPSRMADLVTLIYEEADAKGALDEAFVLKVVKLMSKE